MGFVDSKFSLVFFMIQTVAAGALVIQIESRVQAETPSHVRASVLSVLSSIGRVISIPASLAYGWLLKNQGAFIAVRWVGAIAAVMLIYWAYFVFSSGKGETSST